MADHAYRALLAALITAVSVVLIPGMPWWSWLLAFAILYVAAEAWFSVLPSQPEARGSRGSVLLRGAAVMAVVLVVGALVATHL